MSLFVRFALYFYCYRYCPFIFKQVIIEGFNSIVKYVFLVSLIIVYFANNHVNIAYNNNVTEL